MDTKRFSSFQRMKTTGKSSSARTIRQVTIAGGIKMASGQPLVINARDVSQIVWPTSGTVTAGTCPNSSGMSAAIFVGELTLNVRDGVGESSCPGGQLVLQDVSKLALMAATGSPQRLCINMFSSPPTGMNVELKAAGVGAGRLTFVRLNNNSATVRQSPNDSTASLFVGGVLGSATTEVATSWSGNALIWVGGASRVKIGRVLGSARKQKD